MNRRTNLSYGSLLIAVIFVACHKDSTPPPVAPPTTPQTGTLNINMNYPAVDTSTTTYELIINEPGGKVLLDTIAVVNHPVKAALRTNAKLVDVTTILLFTNPTQYYAFTYKSVDPSGWSNTYPGSYQVSPGLNTLSSTNAQLVVQNFPSSAIYGTSVFR